MKDFKQIIDFINVDIKFLEVIKQYKIDKKKSPLISAIVDKTFNDIDTIKILTKNFTDEKILKLYIQRKKIINDFESPTTTSNNDKRLLKYREIFLYSKLEMEDKLKLLEIFKKMECGFENYIAIYFLNELNQGRFNPITDIKYIELFFNDIISKTVLVSSHDDITKSDLFKIISNSIIESEKDKLNIEKIKDFVSYKMKNLYSSITDKTQSILDTYYEVTE